MISPIGIVGIETDRFFTLGTTEYTTSQTSVHPQYGVPVGGVFDADNDIAIMELNRQVAGIEAMPVFRGTPQVTK
jgi:hypothetical protein